MIQPAIIGHHSHQYKVVPGWGKLDSNVYPVNDCHEMVLDAAGNIFLLTNDTTNNILIYNKSGKLVNRWGKNFPGAHGLSIHAENGGEVLFITDYVRHQVIKTDLGGRVLMVIDYPVETGCYKSAEQFKPTETAIAPNGDIYVTDGYGLQYVIQYNSNGEYIRHWGGLGDEDCQFNCVHGIAIDTRDPENLSLLITSRNHTAFKRFMLEGSYINTIQLPGSFVCRPVIKGKYIYAAVFRSGSNTSFGSGYVTILNENDEVISTPGGTEPMYKGGCLTTQLQRESGIFIHPHDVCVDDEENIYVCQWNSNKSYPIKLERV